MSSSVLTVRIPGALAERLDHLARTTKRPKAFYVKQILDEHLADYEDAYLALERLADKSATYYTTEETERLLGL